jgi:hypothetical protein
VQADVWTRSATARTPVRQVRRLSMAHYPSPSRRFVADSLPQTGQERASLCFAML